uniref:Uncharacterized protein n=1 Tax=Anopheles christyi TaxID=43041 RepID=A0A182KJ32_9DIPT
MLLLLLLRQHPGPYPRSQSIVPVHSDLHSPRPAGC